MTLLDEARAMLRDEFGKQPLLEVFWTAEPWRLRLVPALVEAGYLEPAPEYGGLDFPAWRIAPKAVSELRDCPSTSPT